ncbi:MAG: DUF3786 domain-containing protein [Nitrospirota bacterium]
MISCIMMSSGEEKAWEILKGLDPSIVCKNATVTFNEKDQYYLLRSFCVDFYISPKEKSIKSPTPLGETIVKKYGYFFTHSCLWYLIYAKDVPLTGKLIKPVNIKGGEIFFRGSHVLPLDSLAEKYGADKKTFTKKGMELCAEVLNYGDASIKLLPMPRIPITLILWLKDEEFPPRADLLLDSSCEFHLPLEIIWSIAMMSLLVMM